MCRRLSVVSLVAVVTLALAACSDDSEAKEACVREAYNAAEAAAVVRAYEAGKLGTQKQVESELGGPPGGGPSFFDDSGHLIPYRQLDLDHKVQFVVWMRIGRVAMLTEAARARAVARADPDC